MKKILSSFLWFFYVAIILYIFFEVLHIDTMQNFATALIFEIIGFVALAYFIFCNMFSKEALKVSFFVPLLMTTLFYTIVLNVINMAYIASVSNVIFTLIHLVLLFVYCLTSIPMYLMGRS